MDDLGSRALVMMGRHAPDLPTAPEPPCQLRRNATRPVNSATGDGDGNRDGCGDGDGGRGTADGCGDGAGMGTGTADQGGGRGLA